MSVTARLRSPARAARGAARRLNNLRDRLFAADTLVQSGQTPFELIHTQDIIQLRCYTPTATPVHAVPVVLVAPLAVNMTIYDLFPERSLVRDLLARGYKVYLIDWGRPDAAHDHWRLKTYITEFMPALLAQVRAHAGTRTLSLHGWSFGGLFAYGYTAWSGDADIRNLVLLGAPCDYHDNGAIGRQHQRLSRVIRGLGKVRALRPHATPPRLWRAPGWFNSALYKLTAPAASLRPYLDLLTELHDREKVAAHATHAAFLDDMVAYPGRRHSGHRAVPVGRQRAGRWPPADSGQRCPALGDPGEPAAGRRARRSDRHADLHPGAAEVRRQPRRQGRGRARRPHGHRLRQSGPDHGLAAGRRLAGGALGLIAAPLPGGARAR